VTWVLDGALTHRDGDRVHVVGAGEVQVLSAGSGVRHSETVDESAGATRFLQTWVRPDAAGTVPSYRTAAVDVGADFTVVVGPGGLPIGTRGANLAVARAEPGQSLALPSADLGHLFVARGQVALGLTVLTEADAARLTDEGPVELTCLEDAELVFWALPAAR